MHAHDKDAATETLTPRVMFRGKLMQIISGTLLCVVPAVAVHAGEFNINDKLRGITSVRYRMYFELMFRQTRNRLPNRSRQMASHHGACGKPDSQTQICVAIGGI
jgi:hypothetical protein